MTLNMNSGKMTNCTFDQKIINQYKTNLRRNYRVQSAFMLQYCVNSVKVCCYDKHFVVRLSGNHEAFFVSAY